MIAHRKILAIKLRALGDTVLMTAPLLELHRAFPQSQTDILIPENWAALFEGFPGVSRIWTLPTETKGLSRLMQYSSISLRLRQEKYDSVVNFHASPSSAKLARTTGAKTRAIHFHGHQDPNQYSTLTIPGKGILKPIIERDMDTLRAMGLHIPAGRLPEIFLQPIEKEEAAQFIEKLNLPKPLLGLSLGSGRPTKSWPMERFTSLAVEWIKKEKGGVLAIAGPSEEDLIHKFLHSIDDLLSITVPVQSERAFIRNRIGTTHQLPLKKLAAVLSQLSVLASNDSGPRHLAVATHTPTVTLFGPEDPYEWHPYPAQKHPYLFVKDLACRKSAAPGMPPWCGISVCVTEEHRCMRLIGVDPVLEACRSVASNR